MMRPSLDMSRLRPARSCWVLSTVASIARPTMRATLPSSSTMTAPRPWIATCRTFGHCDAELGDEGTTCGRSVLDDGVQSVDVVWVDTGEECFHGAREGLGVDPVEPRHGVVRNTRRSGRPNPTPRPRRRPAHVWLAPMSLVDPLLHWYHHRWAPVLPTTSSRAHERVRRVQTRIVSQETGATPRTENASEKGSGPMPQEPWTEKRERQYEHIKDSLEAWVTPPTSRRRSRRAPSTRSVPARVRPSRGAGHRSTTSPKVASRGSAPTGARAAGPTPSSTRRRAGGPSRAARR